MLHHQRSTTSSVNLDAVPAMSPLKAALLSIKMAPPGEAPSSAQLHLIARENDLPPRQVWALAARHLSDTYGMRARDIAGALNVGLSEVYRYLEGLDKSNAKARAAQAAYRARRRGCGAESPGRH